MDFFDAVSTRHSIRRFEDRAVEQEKLDKVFKVIDSAPSAGDLQGYEVVVVRNGDARRKLSEAAYGQDSLVEAHIVLVFCADHLLSGSKYGQRGADLYSIQDATIAAAYAQLASTSLGLSSVWVGAFDPAKVAAAIEAPNDITPVAMIPIGYAAEEPKASARRPISDIIREGSF